MVKSRATSPEAYLAELPPERRETSSGVRKVILDNLPEGYEEGIQHGMISYHVPLERYPDTYNGQPLPIAALASQKNHMSLYLMCVYGDPETEQQLRECFAAGGKKLAMGKSCVRFKKPEDLSLDAVGEAISRTPPDRLIEQYERARAG